MIKQKINGRVWFTVGWTFFPLIFAIVLIIEDVFETSLRGLVIQWFVMLPLFLSLKGKFFVVLHDIADLASGNKGDKYKKTVAGTDCSYFSRVLEYRQEIEL